MAHVLPAQVTRGWVVAVCVAGTATALDLLIWDSEVTTTTGGTLPWWLPVGLTIAAHLSLIWRRQHPLPVLAVQLCFALASLVVPLWQPLAGLLVAIYTVAAVLDQPQARWAWLAAVPLVAHSVAQWRFLGSAPVGLAQGLGLYLTAGTVAWLIGTAVRHQRRRLAEAESRERRRLARDLHDGVAGTVSAVVVQAAVARTCGGSDDRLHGIEATARRACAELQAIVARDRAGQVRALDGLPALLDSATTAGMAVRLRTRGEPHDLPEAAETALFRTLQEAVTNALKHAGPGGQLNVDVRWLPDAVEVAVVDRPVGRAPSSPPPPSGGHGLLGLQERLRGVGGSLHIRRCPDGFRLRARVPVSVP